MTEQEIIRHIDAGANFYVSLFGNAEHMEMVDTGFYSYVKPKEGEHGISIIYHIRMDNLAVERQKELVAEMKALHMPIWVDLRASDELFALIFGKEKMHGQTIFEENDEIYMALMPEEKKDISVSNNQISKVKSPEEFVIWAKVANDVLAGGYTDMHPVYHYPLCQKGFMKCYILYHQSKPVAVAGIVDNQGIASLEFVATIPEMRRKGFAQAVCERAVQEAFADGAKIVTVRAANATAGRVYERLGFKAYNYAI